MLRHILASIAGLTCCASLQAEVRVEYLLGEHYRSGRYVPVRVIAIVENADSGAAVQVAAEGAVPTVLPLRDGRADAVVPWLVMRAPVGEMVVRAGDDEVEMRAPRRPLAAGEVLIGHVTEDVGVSARWFGDREVIPVGLDAADPLPGHPAAWEALDALLLDRPGYQRLRADAVPVLLSAGVVLMVRSDEAPDDRWPWVRFEDHWVMGIDVAGPRGGFDDRYYEPAHGWRAGWPAGFRWQVMLLGVVVGCLAGGAALWRSRWAAAGVVVVCAGCVAGIAGWRSMQMPVPHVGGDVLAQHEALVQRDGWQYQAAIQAADGAFAWRGLSRPMVAGQWHLDRMQLTLRCRADGEPAAFVYHLPAGVRMAFLTREVEAAMPAGEPRLPIRSPLERLVRAMYLRPGDELRGEIREADRDWPAIVLHRGGSVSSSRRR